MKITKLQKEKATFDTLENGNVFTSNRSEYTCTYMKIVPILGKFNAVDLENGRTTHFEPTESIVPYWNAYITLE